MAAKSTPKARSRSKTNSVLKNPSYPFIAAQYRKTAWEKWHNEIMDYFKNAPKHEREIIRSVVLDLDNMRPTLNELKAMVGESLPKCKIIPFPVGGKLSRKV